MEKCEKCGAETEVLVEGKCSGCATVVAPETPVEEAAAPETEETPAQ